MYNRILTRRNALALIGGAALTLLPASLTPAREATSSVLLILDKSGNKMLMAHPVTGEVIARIPTGEGPHEVVAVGNLAVVGNFGHGQPGNTLSVIDLRERKEIRRVDLGHLTRPHGLAVSNGKVYFTAEGAEAVGRYDPKTNKVDWTAETGQAGTHMVIVSSDAKRIFTTDMGSDTVTLLTQKGEPKHIPVGKTPEALDLTPDGKELWVGLNGEGAVAILDAATGRVKEKIEGVARVPIRVKLTPDGKRALVSDAPNGDLVILDVKTRKVEKRIPVGQDVVGIQLSPKGDHAYASSARTGKVSIIDMKELKKVGEVVTGGNPDGLAWAQLRR